MPQLWMPSLSICKSLSELDDTQLKVSANYAITLSKIASSTSYETNVQEPLRVITYSKLRGAEIFARCKKFIDAYAEFAKEEMQYRFGNDKIIQNEVSLPLLYHIVYHGRIHTMYSVQPFTKLEGEIMPINFLMREVLSKLWRERKVRPTWTKRVIPEWCCEKHLVYEKNGKLYLYEKNSKLYLEDLSLAYNEDGTLYLESIPNMIYKKASDNFVKLSKVILK